MCRIYYILRRLRLIRCRWHIKRLLGDYKVKTHKQIHTWFTIGRLPQGEESTGNQRSPMEIYQSVTLKCLSDNSKYSRNKNK